MQTFHPKIEVRLIKTHKRDVITDGLNVAARYQKLGAIDLTPYLADGEAVHVQQFVGGSSGTWGMMLVDRMIPEYKESLYGMIEPMDMVEIRMARSPHEYQGKSGQNSYKLPIVMRGFVSHVQRSRTIADGRPVRSIQLAGHDFGKILEIIRIYYLNNSAIGDNILGEFKFFHKYASLDEAKIMSGNDFVKLVCDVVINPFLARLTVNADGANVEAKAIHQIMPDVDVDGNVSPLAVSIFTDGTVSQFLAHTLDIGAFNEMFLDDREEEVALVVRRNPFVDLSGGRIQQGASVQVLDVKDEEIEGISESRSDAGVANYFWIANAAWNYIDNMTLKELAAAAPTKDYVLFDYINTLAGRYGFRKMEVESRMGPSDQQFPDEANQALSLSETDRRVKWLNDRRRILAEQNKDNVVLENGTIHLMGNEKIKRGMYLRATYGNFPAMYYLVGVYHQFIPFQSFKTVATFERGTGFVERARLAEAPYLTENSLKGVQ